MEETVLRWTVKRELRKRMRGVRNTLPATAVAQRSREIIARIEGSDLYQQARSVGLFWPIEGRNEVDLRPLLDRARGEGKLVALPATTEEGAEICLRSLEGPGQLDLGPLGFEEPPPEAPLVPRVDLLVVPALAVDPKGHRIGYGKGYYDRLLDRMEKPYTSLVVAYDFQLLVEVPVLEGDRAVEWVVTDRRMFRAGEDPGSGFEAPGSEGIQGGEGRAEEAGIRVIRRPPRG
jgi:5-formyltetrahydrofolate cyclo-ligase